MQKRSSQIVAYGIKLVDVGQFSLMSLLVFYFQVKLLTCQLLSNDGGCLGTQKCRIPRFSYVYYYSIGPICHKLWLPKRVKLGGQNTWKLSDFEATGIFRALHYHIPSYSWNESYCLSWKPTGFESTLGLNLMFTNLLLCEIFLCPLCSTHIVYIYIYILIFIVS